MTDQNLKPNELEEVMERAYRDPEQMDSFYALLLSSDLFIVTDEDPTDEGPRILEKDETVSIVQSQTQEGTMFVPVFTSLRELQAAITEENSYMAMDGWNLFSMLQGSDIVINPHTDMGLHMRADDIENLLAHFSANPLTMQKDTEVMLGMPADDPAELKKSLADIFKKDGRVQSAHLALMMNAEKGEKSLVVGVVFRPGEEYPQIFNMATPAVKKYLPEGCNLDFMILNNDSKKGVGRYLLEQGDHFFRAHTSS